MLRTEAGAWSAYAMGGLKDSSNPAMVTRASTAGKRQAKT